MAALTTTYSFNLPTVNSATDEDLWGAQLNSNWTDLDALLDLREQNLNFADFEIQRCVLKDYAEEIPSNVAISSNAATIDFEAGNHVTVDVTENLTTLTISNPPASGRVGMIVIYMKVDGSGGHTWAWPSKVHFPNNEDHVLTTTANRTDIVTLVTRDGGTTYAGLVSGQNIATI